MPRLRLLAAGATAPGRSLRLSRALAALALLLAIGLLAGEAATRREKRDLLARAEALGLPQEARTDLAASLDSEESPARARLALARALVAHEFDATRWKGLAPGAIADERRRSAERLDAAEALAVTALGKLPASWEAPFLLGGSRLLGLLVERDARLFRDPEIWEAPLTLAKQRAPVFPDSSRLLTAAYLETWPMLRSAARREAARVLAEAFADPATFDRFFPTWSRLARNTDELYQPLPDRPEVWQRVASFHAEKADWSRWSDARERAERSRRARVRGLIDEARARARGGDANGASATYLRAAQQTWPGTTDVAALDQAIGERPAGPAGTALAGTGRAWIDWAAPLALFDRTPLADDTMQRLARSTPGLLPDQLALALLAGGDLAAAEVVERREESLWNEAWGGYLVLKAAVLLDRDEPADAAAALALVHRDWKKRLPYLLVRARLARADATLAPRGEAEAALAAARRSEWEATEWRWRGSIAYLELYPQSPTRALRLELTEVPKRGAVVELQWNGVALPPRVVPPEAREITLPFDLSTEPGLLRLETLAGGRVRPGRVTLSGG